MKRLILIILSMTGFLLTSLSCNKEENDFGYVNLSFNPRVCKYVILYNSGIVSFGKEEIDYFLSGDSDNIEANDYLIHVNVTSFTPYMRNFTHSAGAYRCEPDKEKEKKIEADIKTHRMAGEEVDVSVEYRMEKCMNIKIKSSSVLFGREPGEDLTDKFIFRALPPYLSRYSCQYYFVGDNELRVINDKMLIEEYLNSSPTFFADAYFGFKEVPAEVPLTTNFTVEMTLEDGKVLSGTSNEVMLN